MTVRFSNQLVAELYQPFWAGGAHEHGRAAARPSYCKWGRHLRAADPPYAGRSGLDHPAITAVFARRPAWPAGGRSLAGWASRTTPIRLRTRAP